MTKIKTTYIDNNGEIKTQMISNGIDLRLTIDNIEFGSNNLTDFQTIHGKAINERFDFDKNDCLTNFKLIVKIPIEKECNGVVNLIDLNCTLDNRLSDRGYNETIAECYIEVNNEIIKTGSLDLFEGAFDIINSKLPKNTKLNCCYNCLYSDYSVYGQDIWGTMLCFKKIKTEYLRVQDKDEYMEIMDKSDKLVPETFTCGEFTTRIDGTGYRG